MLEELRLRLLAKIEKQLLPSRFLLSKFNICEELRSHTEFTDSYWSFWYYLGEDLKPKTILDLGTDLSLESPCCTLGGSTQRAFLICGNQSDPGARQNLRLNKSNMKLAGIREFVQPSVGGIYFDLAIVHGDFPHMVALIWEAMSLDGILCVIDGRAGLEQFAKGQNRVPVFCELRHNVGLLRK
jgi:hypothetical protein